MKLRIVTENGRELHSAHEVRIPGWTERRFFEEAPEEGFFEFKDGELIMRSPVGIPHQRIVGFLGSLIRNFVESRELGEVFTGPAVLRLRVNLDREPDLFFVSRARRGRVTDQHVRAPVDLIVEVTSPGSESRDLEEKREEYERAEIPVYWVVDPTARAVHSHVLEEKRYRVRKFTEGSLTAAPLPGFRVQVEWLWLSPLPLAAKCLEDMS